MAQTLSRTDGRNEPVGRGVPERTERWRQPLLLARHAVDDTLRLVDEVERLTNQLEWLLNHGSVGNSASQAGFCLKRAWDRLLRAVRRNATTCLCLDRAQAAHEGAALSRLFTDTSGDALKAMNLMLDSSQRLEALTTEYFAITAELSGGGIVIALQQHYVPKHALPPVDPRFDHEQPPSPPPSPTCSRGYRRVFRGRAPPANRTARLHAVSAAAEKTGLPA